MSFFEVRDSRLQRVTPTTLAEAAIWERRDLQALLRQHLPELVPDLLVIAEEFGDWDDSKRRIDLLALDRDANLVVIELKRGDTGVHMELQALRYAAMVSTMTFEQAVTAHGTAHPADELDARTAILDHLGWSEPSEEEFAQDVRIVLFSEDFSRELTTSILWLNNRGLDITAFRISSYDLDGRLLLDFQQIIPLKEAEEYQVKVRNKQQVEQNARRAKVPWNGEYYVSYGAGRPWSAAREYGFISGGGGPWFSRTLNLLSEGDRVWVNIPNRGYVGVAEVTAAAVPIDDFTVVVDGRPTPLLELVGDLYDYRTYADSPDEAEYVVAVRWLDTVPDDKPLDVKGLFGNQNTVCKPTTPLWDTTVERLKLNFPGWNTRRT